MRERQADDFCEAEAMDSRVPSIGDLRTSLEKPQDVGYLGVWVQTIPQEIPHTIR